MKLKAAVPPPRPPKATAAEIKAQDPETARTFNVNGQEGGGQRERMKEPSAGWCTKCGSSDGKGIDGKNNNMFQK